MSFFSDIANDNGKSKQTFERKALPAGAYGWKPKDTNKPHFDAQLRIVKAIAPRDTKDPDLKQYSFLVVSDGAEGAAFLQLSLKKLWLEPAAMALAFDRVESAIAEGLTNESEVQIVRDHILNTAKEKVAQANTPEDQVEEAVAKQVENVYTSIRINVGVLYRLVACAGLEEGTDARNLDFNTLVHAQFSGEVVPGRNGDTAEVKSVFKPRVN